MAQAPHQLDTAELLALLRDASLKPESIAEEMRCAGRSLRSTSRSKSTCAAVRPISAMSRSISVIGPG